MDVAVEVLWFGLGVLLVLLVLDSAVRTFVLPRGVATVLTRVVFVGLRIVFDAIARMARTYDGRDAVMALYGPIGLLLLPFVWILFTVLAFAAMFHALGVSGYEHAIEMSGSSLFTLGFVRPPDFASTCLAFLEAAFGLGLLALLIAYLPTIYNAFSRREVMVGQLATFSGEPPSGVEILLRTHRMERSHLLGDVWVQWQGWFAEIEETHTSLAVVNFFRSPKPHRSWVTAAGAVLDAASLRLAVVDGVGFDPQAGLLVRSGRYALNAVAGYFDLPHNPDPAPTDPILVTRDEFEEACDELVAAGIGVRTDRDAAWADFAGWRVNYDLALVSIAGLVMAPYAPWSSDRSARNHRPRLHHLRRFHLHRD
jgi:hypothetical protein